MAVGLNTVREVAQRNPLAISEDLLQDLTQYKKHIDRGVTSAAKGLIQLYRQEAPMLLNKKVGTSELVAPFELTRFLITLFLERDFFR